MLCVRVGLWRRHPRLVEPIRRRRYAVWTSCLDLVRAQRRTSAQFAYQGAAVWRAAGLVDRRPMRIRFPEMDRSGVEEDGGYICGDIISRRCGVVIVGAVHIAQRWCPMAQVAGFDAVVIDPRRGVLGRKRVSPMHKW